MKLLNLTIIFLLIAIGILTYKIDKQNQQIIKQQTTIEQFQNRITILEIKTNRNISNNNPHNNMMIKQKNIEHKIENI